MGRNEIMARAKAARHGVIQMLHDTNHVLNTRQLAPRPKGAAKGPAPTGPAVQGVRGTYTIVRTDEVDAKDVALSADERTNIAGPTAAAAMRSAGDDFTGKARKTAKLSISDAGVSIFNDVSDLIDTLPSKRSMVRHNPHITTAEDSDRVAEEERNVSITAFLYAAGVSACSL
jgi:hypothetical protein